jgi:ABC-type Mn2+/Zn2+ transport system permease subunit
VLSITIALVATVGGILASLQWAGPPSFYISLLSFAAFVGALLRSRQLTARR